MSTRRRFSGDFKAKVALEALRGDKTVGFSMFPCSCACLTSCDALVSIQVVGNTVATKLPLGPYGQRSDRPDHRHPGASSVGGFPGMPSQNNPSSIPTSVATGVHTLLPDRNQPKSVRPTPAPFSEVCSFRLPKVSSFRLPLTPWAYPSHRPWQVDNRRPIDPDMVRDDNDPVDGCSISCRRRASPSR